jgi:membrane-associated protease RseP (regulator of RpoE activity)
LRPALLLAEMLVLAPFSFILTVLLHELSHCAVVWAQGGRVVGFHVGFGADGAMSYVDTKGSVDDRLVSLAPLAKALLLSSAWVVLGILVHLPLLVLVPAEIGDALEWIHDYMSGRKGSDGADYRRL